MPRHWRLPGAGRSRLKSRPQEKQDSSQQSAESSSTTTAPPPQLVKGFITPVTSAWDLALPGGTALGRLLAGFRPSAMEDKWMVWVEEQTSASSTAADGATEESGGSSVAVLHFIRSWTGFPIAEVTVEIGAQPGRDARFTKIVWE